jgi:hypothetical protein
MKMLKRILMGFGAVALAASLATLVAPKSVHAAVAALVQVTNNIANPVPTQDVYRSVTQMVTLYCAVTISPEPCVQIGPSGLNYATGYVVPTGQNLVITDIDVVPPAGKGVSIISVQPSPDPIPSIQEGFAFANDGATHQLHFQSGLVYASGASLISLGNVGLGFFARGYLTPN